MSLKRYDELTRGQRQQVSIMYSDLSNLGLYLYNFDNDGKYHGRQYAPGEMTLVNEPVQENEAGKKLLEKAEVKEIDEKIKEILPEEQMTETPKHKGRRSKK